jgi:hypothetical protein
MPGRLAGGRGSATARKHTIPILSRARQQAGLGLFQQRDCRRAPEPTRDGCIRRSASRGWNIVSQSSGLVNRSRDGWWIWYACSTGWSFHRDLQRLDSEFDAHTVLDSEGAAHTSSPKTRSFSRAQVFPIKIEEGAESGPVELGLIAAQSKLRQIRGKSLTRPARLHYAPTS